MALDALRLPEISGDSREGHSNGPADGGGMPRGGPRSRSRATPPHSDIVHRKPPGPHRDSLKASSRNFWRFKRGTLEWSRRWGRDAQRWPRSRSRATPPHSDIVHRKPPGPHRDSLPAGPGGLTHISGIDYHSIPHEHLRARVPVDPKVARVARSSMPGA
jgi:hypothetical protein